jgi:hypothetical protein
MRRILLLVVAGALLVAMAAPPALSEEAKYRAGQPILIAGKRPRPR